MSLKSYIFILTSIIYFLLYTLLPISIFYFYFTYIFYLNKAFGTTGILLHVIICILVYVTNKTLIYVWEHGVNKIEKMKCSCLILFWLATTAYFP